MMEAIHALREALNGVPVTLLRGSDAKVYDDIASSLAIIERFADRSPTVVLVGPSGAGKSYVFNAVVGADSSAEGVIRPTTTMVVTTADPPDSLVRLVPDHTPLPVEVDDIGLIDTPGWEIDSATVLDAVAAADVAALVVSPIRYADASVSELWANLDRDAATVILNRVESDSSERSDLLASVTEVFGVAPYVISEGGDGAAQVGDFLASAVSGAGDDAILRIMTHSAVSGTRYIVRAVTNAAPEIGKVAAAVDNLPECVLDVSSFPVTESWNATRDEIVDAATRMMRDRDDDIVRSSGTPLAERILEVLGPWDESVIAEAADAWHSGCVERFTEIASIRWRRARALQLIERFSWSSSINPSIAVPKRFTRITADGGPELALEMQSELESMLCGFLDARSASWRAMLRELGGFQPAPLVDAAEAMSISRGDDG